MRGLIGSRRVGCSLNHVLFSTVPTTLKKILCYVFVIKLYGTNARHPKNISQTSRTKTKSQDVYCVLTAVSPVRRDNSPVRQVWLPATVSDLARPQ
eukprot:1468255-Prymnesium_polylepis.1